MTDKDGDVNQADRARLAASVTMDKLREHAEDFVRHLAAMPAVDRDARLAEVSEAIPLAEMSEDWSAAAELCELLAHYALRNQDRAGQDRWIRRALTNAGRIGGREGKEKVLVVLHQLARSMIMSGPHDEMRVVSERAVAMAENLYGPSDHRVARHLSMLSIAVQDDRPREIELKQRALGLLQQSPEVATMTLGEAHHDLGLALWSHDRRTEAEEHLRKAVELVGELPLRDQTLRMAALASLLRETGRIDEALVLFERIVEIERRHTDPASVSLAHARYDLALTLFHQHAPESAQRAHEVVGTALSDAQSGQASSMRAFLHCLASRLLAALGDAVGAAREAQLAIADAEATGRPEVVARVRDSLSED